MVAPKKIYADDKMRYKLMITQLDLYENNKLSLLDLIDGLESLLYALEENDKYWKVEFIRNWSVLEIAYASVESFGRKDLLEQDKIEIKKAIKNLRVLVESKVMPS